MTITFFSNFLNIHQLPFCEELIKHIGESNFHFVATKKIDDDRIQMGFEDMNITKPFVVRAYENDESFEKAKELAKNSDVGIIGSAKDVFLDIRMANNKLTFLYYERLFKKGYLQFFNPRSSLVYIKRFTRYRNKNLFVLCASAYTRSDLSLYGFPRKKCFKWAYFPEIKKYSSFSELWEKKRLRDQEMSILWVGRLIEWKHPEMAVYVANYLKGEGFRFSLSIIGDGDKYEEVKKLIQSLNLNDCVKLLGPQNHEFVLSMMEKSSVFLFTSDKQEGWGAVLNEAMNAGCAVVANQEIGSVPFLIQSGVNGFIYHNKKELLRYVGELCSSSEKQKEFAMNAWKTMNECWDVTNAVNQFMLLIEYLRNANQKSIIKFGPCSLA